MYMYVELFHVVSTACAGMNMGGHDFFISSMIIPLKELIR